MTLTIGRFGCALCVLGIAVTVPLIVVDAGRAYAEDTGFWETFRGASRGFQGVAPSPSWAPQPLVRRPPPFIRRASHPKPQIVEVPEQPITIEKPPDPANRPNPLALLLSDSTLRPGDIVVFPDGPRVFKGRPGTQHAVLDFAKLSTSKDVPRSARKLLASLPVGENDAWSSNPAARGGQLARNAVDIETTGALPRKGRSHR